MLFFKKKKPRLTEEQRKWNLLWDRYADGSLEETYYVLCDYHAGINGGGHDFFFDNNEERLSRYAEVLKTILPNEFYTEFSRHTRRISKIAT